MKILKSIVYGCGVMGSALAFAASPAAAPAAPAAPAAAAPAAAPAESPPLVFADAEFRSQAPKPGPLRELATPQAQRWKLSNGLEVVLVERHELPVVTLELVLPGGSAWDPPGKEGLASLCMALQGEGTQALDKLQLSEALADLASTLGTWASVDQQGLQAATLKRHLQPTLDLFADTLLKPGLRQEELQRLVARRQAALQASKGNPASVAARVGAAVAFGPQHGWGRLVQQASLAALTVGDCQDYAARLSPQGARLYVVGDLTRAEVDAELGKRLAPWTRRASKLAALGAPKPMAGKLFFVEQPGAEQSVIAVMHQGPQRQAKDYEATALMMAVLGGGFSSRINMNLREKHGWAYGAGGGYGYRPDGSLLTLQANVRADATGPAITEIFKEMATIRDQPVTAEELERERQGAILSLPARWASGRSIASTFQSLLYYGLPLDWFGGYARRTQALQAPALLKAAQQHVKPADAVVLVVGDPAKVRGQLDALLADGPLKGGALVRLDADGQPLR